MKPQEVLSKKIQTKNNEILEKSAKIAHQQNLLAELFQKLEEYENQSDHQRKYKIKALGHSLQNELPGKPEVESFKHYFDQANHNFTIQLQKKHTKLTSHDV